MDTTNPRYYSQNRSFQHDLGVELLQQYMRWEEGDTVLDAGCGTGEICKYISQQPGVSSVVGLDVSPDFVRYSSQQNSSPNVLYDVSDISDASTIKPEWQGAFSKVVSFQVLHWVKDKAAALKVLHSCLKPHGEILFWVGIDVNKWGKISPGMASHPKWKVYLKDFEPNLFPWPSSDLVKESHSSYLLEECGFEVLSCHLKEQQYSFTSREQWKKTMSAVFRHLCYLPPDKHEEFLNDVEKMERDVLLLSGDYKFTDKNLVIHARKL
ncbi:PREDICTED: juvenile hormone acid O-methyltransferase-like [Branchiostoma belcheri]|uniref:Juvenile hormone acid O-methyltransferase-like n=1 Tax=Branchiostoma belcheri TaxID=7741 RepID=A0A6P4YGW4_BRABE|nr:PREDICTED: juvenile hormone acid O-methyltransferase-like [Branchiostoma belcheri]